MSAQAWRTNRTTAGRGYGSKWQTYAKAFLGKHPLCKLCRAIGRTVAATIVDHIKPHRGDWKLFWDKTNHQGLCEHCHNSVKQKLEKSGVLIGCDANGMPLDPNHHWNHAQPTTQTDGAEDRLGQPRQAGTQ